MHFYIKKYQKIICLFDHNEFPGFLIYLLISLSFFLIASDLRSVL